ncbi:mitochondrial ribosomal protein L18 [Arctopsyche grandis]|uniref:mitochondrial ribosomal protein L18 n=1 Tax=Arctopsyche grandis TaxID=121162 RepID=UPI00406D7761
MLRRCLSSAASASPAVSVAPVVFNRNPRNLEKLRIGYRPDGYHLDERGRSFWHKLVLEASGKHILAKVVHFENGPVIEASTAEWAIKKQLYRYADTCAHINLGRILARRCLQFGIIEMRCDIKPIAGGKVEKFLQHLENGGVRLKEEKQIKKEHPLKMTRNEKPWLVHETN